MDKKKEDRKTIFRRIRGRIVPISVGAGYIGAGLAIGSKKVSKAYEKRMDKYSENVASGKSRNRRLNFFSGQNKIDAANNRYNKILTKASGEHFYGGGTGKYNPLVKREGAFTHHQTEYPKKYRIPPKEGRGFAQIYTGRSPKQIVTNVKNTPLMLHELGHKKQYTSGTTVFNFFKKVGDSANKSYIKAFNMKQHRTGFNLKKDSIRLGHIAKQATLFKVLKARRFSIEMDASYQAVKMAKKLRGKNFAKITAKAMIPSVLTYGKSGILKGGKAALIGVGAYSIYKGIRRRDEPRSIFHRSNSDRDSRG